MFYASYLIIESEMIEKHLNLNLNSYIGRGRNNNTLKCTFFVRIENYKFWINIILIIRNFIFEKINFHNIVIFIYVTRYKNIYLIN